MAVKQMQKLCTRAEVKRYDLGHYYKLSKSDPNAVFCSQMLFREALVAVKQMQKLCTRENFKASSNISLTKAYTCPLLNLARNISSQHGYLSHKYALLHRPMRSEVCLIFKKHK